MSEEKRKKDKKIQLWCTAGQLEKIDDAARETGLSRTGYMITAALEKARRLKRE